MRSFLYMLLGVALCLPLSAKTAAERDEFVDRQLEKILGLYHAGKRAEALDQVDEGMVRMKEEFGNNYHLYKRVWTEAQIKSGDKDEAWGLDLYLRLLRSEERDHNAPGARKSEIHYLIYVNITGMLRTVGRITDARELVQTEQANLLEFANMDPVNRPYGDRGPLFTFLPDARKRNFPVMLSDVKPGAKPGTLISYPRIYAVDDISKAALEVGDWVRAAELARWVADYAAVYCQRDIPRVREVARHGMYSYTRLANICIAHGFPAEADAMFTEFITLASKEGYPAEPAALAAAKLGQLVIRGELGTLPDNAVGIAEESSATIAGYTYFERPQKFDARVKVARIHFAKGNRARAWEIIAELSAMAEADRNPHYRMLLLTPMIDFALAEGGTHPKLEEWLAQSLNFERSMGNKFNELALYEKYARFLMLNGRHTEALAIMEEAVRLSVAMKLPFRAEKNREILKEIKARVEEESRMVDLQPMSSRSTVLKGSNAYTRFYLTNPSSVKKTGNLRMTGPFAMDILPGDGQLSVILDTVLPAIEIEHPLVLAPGASIAVDVTGVGAKDDVETEFSCAWFERGKSISEGIWLFKSSDVATRTSVVDAHAVKISPFHLIPIRHMIQRNGAAGSSENVDIRIAASEPMRIEVYDGSGTNLIAVDANGDGDFQDKGDLVYQDLNGNGHPDLTMAEGKTLVSLTMYVDPVQIQSGDATAPREVSISVLQDGEWHEDAVDVIK